MLIQIWGRTTQGNAKFPIYRIQQPLLIPLTSGKVWQIENFASVRTDFLGLLKCLLT